MFILTKSLQQRISASLDSSPLRGDEVRRIEGLGNHFICLDATPVSEDYATLLSFDYKGTPTRLLFKT